MDGPWVLQMMGAVWIVSALPLVCIPRHILTELNDRRMRKPWAEDGVVRHGVPPAPPSEQSVWWLRAKSILAILLGVVFWVLAATAS